MVNCLVAEERCINVYVTLLYIILKTDAMLFRILELNVCFGSKTWTTHPSAVQKFLDPGVGLQFIRRYATLKYQNLYFKCSNIKFIFCVRIPYGCMRQLSILMWIKNQKNTLFYLKLEMLSLCSDFPQIDSSRINEIIFVLRRKISPPESRF